MISFRVSEAEFEQLRNRSEAEGARSISDYARASLCGGAAPGGERQIQALSDGIERLSGDIRRLSELIETPQHNQNLKPVAANDNGGDIS